MFKLVFPLITLALRCSSENMLDALYFLDHPDTRSGGLRKESFFPTLENYHVNAVPATETKYPWIARVIHSRNANVPHMCTAVCIDQAIFVTASRCIYTLKVNYTTVLYMSTRFAVLAFVFPSKPTKQAFDDIGIIIVDSKNYNRKWVRIELYNAPNRTDNAYQWFNKSLVLPKIKYKVVGYAVKKGLHKLLIAEKQYDLTELNVVVNLELCGVLLTKYSHTKTGYYFPCYHSCTLLQFEKSNEKCFLYHGVEGGAVFDTATNKLIGIATWGTYFSKYELPVGFTVLNSDNFFKDLTCARRIRDGSELLITQGYYQSLCDNL